MARKRRRLYIVVAALLVFGGAVFVRDGAHIAGNVRVCTGSLTSSMDMAKSRSRTVPVSSTRTRSCRRCCAGGRSTR